MDIEEIRAITKAKEEEKKAAEIRKAQEAILERERVKQANRDCAKSNGFPQALIKIQEAALKGEHETSYPCHSWEEMGVLVQMLKDSGYTVKGEHSYSEPWHDGDCGFMGGGDSWWVAIGW